MAADAPGEALAAALAEPLRDAYYTAVAAEVGFLGEDQPRWRWEGTTDTEATTPLVFDVASLSKALMTAPLMWRHAAGTPAGLRLDATLAEAFPALATVVALPGTVLGLRIGEILAHRSGLPAWRNFWIGRLSPDTPRQRALPDVFAHAAEVFARYPEAAWVGKPEERYSDVGFILLGLGLMATHAQSLGSLWTAMAAPVMAKARPDEILCHGSRLAQGPGTAVAVPSAWCALRGRLLRGEVHDENAASFGNEAGHTGLFGSVGGCGHWLRHLWRARETRAAAGWGDWPGWRWGDDAASRPFAGGTARGHWGFTGTGFWVDPASGAYAILLTNRVISGRVSVRIRDVRRAFFTAAGDWVSRGP